MPPNDENGPNGQDAAPDIDAALAQLDTSALEGFELSINPDGTVTFIDFPPEMLEIALALNPDDPLVCERVAIRDGGVAVKATDVSSDGEG